MHIGSKYRHGISIIVIGYDRVGSLWRGQDELIIILLFLIDCSSTLGFYFCLLSGRRDLMG